MVSPDNILNYTDCKIPFSVHIDASEEQLGAGMSQNYKPIALFLKN